MRESIGIGRLQSGLQLADIGYRAQVYLVEGRYMLCEIEYECDVDDIGTLGLIRIAELRHLQIPRLSVDIRRVIGNVDASPVGPAVLFPLLECDCVIDRYLPPY